MVEILRRLVEEESFSSDHEATRRCGDLIADLCRELLGRPAE
jgi:hypothetical protein